LWYWGLNSGPSPRATPPALFLWRVFRNRVSRTLCPGWLPTVILLISSSWVARITGVRLITFFYWWITLCHLCKLFNLCFPHKKCVSMWDEKLVNYIDLIIPGCKHHKVSHCVLQIYNMYNYLSITNKIFSFFKWKNKEDCLELVGIFFPLELSCCFWPSRSRFWDRKGLLPCPEPQEKKLYAVILQTLPKISYVQQVEFRLSLFIDLF
jgi:hypothetical protein